jgi:hypothetical protein
MYSQIVYFCYSVTKSNSNFPVTELHHIYLKKWLAKNYRRNVNNILWQCMMRWMC